MMNAERHLLLVNDTLPWPGFGAANLLYRHLKYLKNWQVSVALSKETVKSPENIIWRYLPKTWRIIKLPTKIWWWPPLDRRIPCSLRIRLYFWRSECERILNNSRPSVILNSLGRHTVFAYYLSKIWQIPLFMMIHDRWQIWAKTDFDREYMTEKRAVDVLNYASIVTATSSGLANFYTVNNPEKVSVLYGIPERRSSPVAEWRNSFRTHPVMVCTGSFRQYQLDVFRQVAVALRQLNGTLLLITSNNDYIRTRLSDMPNVEYREPIIDNTRLFDFLREKASCILIPGCFEDILDWKINIPERLVEFSHLGMPMIILSPLDTCLSDWARSHNWIGYSDTLDDNKIFELIKQTTDKMSWFAMAEQSKDVARNEFNADRLQEQFGSKLEAIVK